MRSTPTRSTARLVAVALLGFLLGPPARAEVEPVDGPCRIKLRSGRALEVLGLERAEPSGARWRVILDGGGSVIVPVREIRFVEVLPARAAAQDAHAAAGTGAEDVDVDVDGLELAGVRRCDPASDPSITRWDPLIADAAAKHGLDVTLVRAIVAVESCGDPRAISHKGAVGLMQLLPTTAADYGVRDLHDPASNLEAGCRHLARLHQVIGPKEDLVVAAYNAGEGSVRRANGIPRYRETQKYVRSVLGHRERLRAAEPVTLTASAM